MPRKACEPVRCYDVSRDRLRFFATQYRDPLPGATVVTHIRLIQGFLEELEAKLGGGSVR